MDYSDLRALYINCTLKRSPEVSHTQGLAAIAVMREQGVEVDVIRAVDHPIATGVWPDMREHGWDHDEWPEIHERVMAADILDDRRHRHGRRPRRPHAPAPRAVCPAPPTD